MGTEHGPDWGSVARGVAVGTGLLTGGLLIWWGGGGGDMIFGLFAIVGSLAAPALWTVRAVKAGRMRIPEPRYWWGLVWPFLKGLLILVFAVWLSYALVHFGAMTLELHAERRTAQIRAIKGDVLYMNDGTVCELSDRAGGQLLPLTPEALRGFLAGDAIRYANPTAFAYIYGDPHDDLDYCYLKDETTGWGWLLGKRLTAPFVRSSCPSQTSSSDLFWGLFKRDSWR